MTDAELLERYVREKSDAAFAELVARHVALVYSVARRHVDPVSAEDVAQSVFIELARRARAIDPGAPLVAWLHVVARRLALNAARAAVRRSAREQRAADQLAAMPTDPSPSPWPAIEPLLDEAVESLPPPDRAAILLRFFEGKSLREVGAALGTSDDAAQKRVSRALDQLRAFFLRRGLPVTAAGLATDLSAHALQIVPAGLGASISTAAITFSSAAVSVGTVEATQALAMTTLQKSLAAAGLTLALATGVYEATAFARQASRLAAQEQKAAALTAQLQRVRGQELAAQNRLQAAEAQIDSRLANAGGDAALEARVLSWQANLDQLRAALVQRPTLGIPELQLLSDDAWFEAATKAKLDSDDALRQTLATLRTQATYLMGDKLRAALNAYLRSSDGLLPSQLAQLLPFFDPPIAPAWLDRYELLHTGKLSALPRISQSQIIGPKSFGDVEYDWLLKFGPNGSSQASAMDENVHAAELAATAATGRRLETAAQFLPYLKWPASEAAVEKILANRRRGTKR